jgi:hypothetical protein
MVNDGSPFPEYYSVRAQGPIVSCDDWTMPIDDLWHSYVVYRYPKPKQREGNNARH